MDIEDILEMLERLDSENESQRLRILDLAKWMEEAVTAQVACERRLAEIDTHRRSLEAELDAIHRSRSWRMLAPVRGMVARLRAGGRSR